MFHAAAKMTRTDIRPSFSTSRSYGAASPAWPPRRHAFASAHSQPSRRPAAPPAAKEKESDTPAARSPASLSAAQRRRSTSGLSLPRRPPPQRDSAILCVCQFQCCFFEPGRAQQAHETSRKARRTLKRHGHSADPAPARCVEDLEGNQPVLLASMSPPGSACPFFMPASRPRGAHIRPEVLRSLMLFNIRNAVC